MNKRFFIGLAAIGLALSACGGDGDGGAELSEAQAAAAQSAIDAAADDGVTLDESCVNEVAAQLSEEDAELAAQDGDAMLSDAGESLGIELLACADEDEIIELFLAGLGETEGLDEDCAREVLEDFDIVGVIGSTQAGEEPPVELIQALVPCFDLGG
ncbi:MAG TPA: hypothetical protein VK853_09525 [Ilumatobacteraceae bacterium]|nr:hypothetical protein [Ilumatobacteraceae bacterium]